MKQRSCSKHKSTSCTRGSINFLWLEGLRKFRLSVSFFFEKTLFFWAAGLVLAERGLELDAWEAGSRWFFYEDWNWEGWECLSIFF